MNWRPWQRKQPEPFDALLRDFTMSGFSTGGFGSTLSTGAALQKVGGWIGIGARPIVDRIAGLRWQAMSDAGEELEKSPLLDLLNRPNPMCSGALTLRMIANWLVLSGDAYLVKSRGRRSGRTVQLWPVAPDRVERVWRDDGTIEYHVAPNAGQNEPVIHPAEDVVRIWRPLPSDPFEPYGAAAMVAEEIAAEQGWRESVRHWFSADARPMMLLEFGSEDLGLTKEQWDRFGVIWRDAMSRRTGQQFGVPMPTPPGARIHELAGLGSAENLKPTEEALRSKILSALGVPPFLLGAAHEANRASAEASLWAFDFSAVKPWTQLIECAVNHSLGEEFPGQRVQFADWVWRDRLAESEIDERLLMHKVISPNEARDKRNLPPADWGDLPVGQMQDQPYKGQR